MKGKSSEEKGITMVVLAVTIIVLIILAGTAIHFMVGENGIFKEADNSKIEYGKAEEKELLIQAYSAVALKTNVDDNVNVKALLEEELSKISEGFEVKEGNNELTVTFPDSGNEYIIEIDNGKVTFAGNPKNDNVILGDKKPSINPSDWTNGTVELTLPQVDGYTTKYTEDVANTKNDNYSKMTDYSSPIKIEKNTTVYYVVFKDNNNKTSIKSITISNIDKEPPIVGATSTTNSITCTGKDNESGIGGYYISESSTKPSVTAAGWTTSATKTNIKQSTLYYVWAKDKVGNISDTVKVTTKTIGNPGDATAKPTDWTTGNVTVTLPTQSGYTTVYSTSGAPTTSSTKYSKPFTVNSHCVIYYAYSDGVIVGTYKTLNIDNIDK